MEPLDGMDGGCGADTPHARDVSARSGSAALAPHYSAVPFGLFAVGDITNFLTNN